MNYLSEIFVLKAIQSEFSRVENLNITQLKAQFGAVLINPVCVSHFSEVVMERLEALN